MGKRKIFVKTDVGISNNLHSYEDASPAMSHPQVFPVAISKVEFGRNPSNLRSFEFAHWYGAGIDSITYACQRQIERFLAGQDGNRTTHTVITHCLCGLRPFLEYCTLRASALGKNLTLAHINRDLIDGFLTHLDGLTLGKSSQKTIYSNAKSVLIALGQHGLLNLINAGDEATFPKNPFPNSNRKLKGETALSKEERQAFAEALRQAIKPIWNEDVTLTGDLLAFVLLIVALHTGRNTTPLLEMQRGCLHSHPKGNTLFLILWKRRGYNTSKVALRYQPEGERLLESLPTVRTNIGRLIRRVEELTLPLDADAPEDLKGRVWLFRPRGGVNKSIVTTLGASALHTAACHLVSQYKLTDSAGAPLRINVSRLRKSFANRIFELRGGDLATTAAALGNTLRVTDQNYLAPDATVRRKWQFMGELLVNELLTKTIGATYKDIPTGHCANQSLGQGTPQQGDGAACTNFMKCVQCKHYVVTSDDLYKVFSFYFRVLSERPRMDRQRWKREYAHIPRLIEHYIIAEGLRRKIFKSDAVNAAREQARRKPHPFWSVDLFEG